MKIKTLLSTGLTLFCDDTCAPKESSKKEAFTFAFSKTLPILLGFLFLGTAYGIYMNAAGFSPMYPIFMAALIFAGSMEFITATLLLAPFDPWTAFFLALMVNARHIFYGLALLEKYNLVKGGKKLYLIFGMCDESFSINYSTEVPAHINASWFMFFVTFLNHIYWVLGAAIGSVLGNFISFDSKGLSFVMTALFIVIFLEQWQKEPSHFSSYLGLAAAVICLLLFGSSQFILVTMLSILLVLSILYKCKKRGLKP